MEGVSFIRKLLITKINNELVSRIIDTMVVKNLIDFLRLPEAPTELKLEIAWIFTNMSFGSKESIHLLVMRGVVDSLLEQATLLCNSSCKLETQLSMPIID